MTTKRLTTEDLAVIEARANAATAHPWHPAHDEFETMSDMTHATCVSLSRGGLTLHLALAGRTHVEAMRATDEAGEDEDAGNVFAAIVGNGPSSAANAAFIAAARTDVPALVAEVRALTAERVELRFIFDALPRCVFASCDNVATWRLDDFSVGCDAHREATVKGSPWLASHPELPYAKALRAMLAKKVTP